MAEIIRCPIEGGYMAYHASGQDRVYSCGVCEFSISEKDYKDGKIEEVARKYMIEIKKEYDEIHPRVKKVDFIMQVIQNSENAQKILKK